MRVVVDTNVWVSALIRPEGGPARILAAYRAGKFTVVTSPPLLTELEEVLARPRLVAKYHLPAEALDLAIDLRRKAEQVEIAGTLALCRDPKDNKVIETAVTGKADALVSGDADLREAPEIMAWLSSLGIPVMTVGRFLLEIV